MAVDFYLQPEGITGESGDANHPGWIECLSVSWSVTQPKSATASTAGGHTAERAELSEISISKVLDVASPIPSQTCAAGKTIPRARLEHNRRVESSHESDRLIMPVTHLIRKVLAMSSWFLMSTSMAQPVAQAPWMTGERLLQLATFRPSVKNNFDLTPAEFVDAELARAYIEGVHDLSEGKSWCYSQRYQPGPDALLDNVYKLKRNAAELIVEIWQRRWPCQAGRTQR